MFHNILAWVFNLLKKIWIHENVLPPPIIEVAEEAAQPELTSGDPTLELLNIILSFKSQHFTLSRSAFDPILYKSILTQFDNHSWYVSMLTLLSNLLQEQLEDTDESVYLDDPLLRGLARGVPTEKELGQFLTDGNVRNINDAFFDLLAKTCVVQKLYIEIMTHPVLRDIQKDYFSRHMFKPIELLKQYMDTLYSHGKLDDSEKETNVSQSNVVSSGQKNQ